MKKPQRCTRTPTIQEAQTWWARKGPASAMRARTQAAKGGKWSTGGFSDGVRRHAAVVLTDRSGDRHYIVCDHGQMVSYGE